MVMQACYKMICVERDHLIVIQALKGLHHVPWQIMNIIQDIQTWINQRLMVTINHIFREANITADWLSKFGHLTMDAFTADFCISSLLQKNLLEDIIGRIFMRRYT